MKLWKVVISKQKQQHTLDVDVDYYKLSKD